MKTDLIKRIEKEVEALQEDIEILEHEIMTRIDYLRKLKNEEKESEK